jgi:hypothetical protein|tara:strand:+ start:781 stop:963 length:183 start_codon:yes stop_codon:yes gene_type:complete
MIMSNKPQKQAANQKLERLQKIADLYRTERNDAIAEAQVLREKLVAITKIVKSNQGQSSN